MVAIHAPSAGTSVSDGDNATVQQCTSACDTSVSTDHIQEQVPVTERTVAQGEAGITLC
jgi:hypothetical protein